MDRPFRYGSGSLRYAQSYRSFPRGTVYAAGMRRA